MIVRRFLAGLLLAGLAVPALGAAPHARAPAALRADAQLPPGYGSRAFARADAEPAAAESPEPSMPAASIPSPETAARARAAFEANRAGKIDRAAYSSEMSAAMSDASVARAAVLLRSIGEVKSFVQVRKMTQGSASAYVFRIEGEKAPAIEWTIAWDAAGKIDYLRFGPAR